MSYWKYDDIMRSILSNSISLLLYNYLRSKMGKTFFDLNSDGIYGPQNGKSKYSNDKTNSRFVISMPENPLVQIFISCVEIIKKKKKKKKKKKVLT